MNKTEGPDKCLPDLKIYDVDEIMKLRSKYPNSESYWKVLPPVDFINARSPAYIYQVIDTNAPITSMAISPNGMALAFCTLLGEIHIYANKDVNSNKTPNWSQIGVLRDEKGLTIDEYNDIVFTPCGKYLFVVGLVRSRTDYDHCVNNLRSLPPSLVKFDLEFLNFSGEESELVEKVVPYDADIKDPLDFAPCERYHGHIDEILSLKVVSFKGENFVITCGRDGHIIKWQFDKNWDKLLSRSMISDKYSSIAFSVSFLPGCCNRYFLAATDNGVQLCDLETEKVTISSFV